MAAISGTTARRVARKLRTGQALGLANRLTALGRFYGDTDKLEHGYFPFYERHFRHLRLDKQVVYEIGVGGFESESPSGSLRIWRDYFLRSTLVGIDIVPKVIAWGDRVRFEQADQSSPADLARIVENNGAPMVVIDDGSHVGEHIWASFQFLWPLMASGAVYVIEDLSTSYYPDFGGGEPTPDGSALGLLRELLDSVQAQDVTFSDLMPDLGTRSAPRFEDVQEVAVYPGIAFIVKA
jgi:hypothetical protein